MMKGIITDIHRTSVVDGPGIRTSVFLKGCPLRCIWCHNPETQSREIERGYGRELDLESVLAECEKDRIYYEESGGGVTLSGGEPLMQADFTIELLTHLKEKEIHTVLDTSGLSKTTVIERSLAVTDLYLFDYKATDPKRHKELVKQPLQPILENLEFLIQKQAAIILRCPLIPGINDDDEHLAAIAEMEIRYPGLQQIDILPWHTMGKSKYERLGRTMDTRLPKENVTNTVLEGYRSFFTKRENRKILIKDWFY